MDRRDFFKFGAQKATRKAVEVVDEKVSARATRWIRPPFALDELEFLLACTRCSDCIEACPHDVVFPLSARLGAQVVATPAMDLLNKGCHLCEDWPCVNACETDALNLPENDEREGDEAFIELPKLAHASVDKSRCLPYLGPECGTCKYACPVDNAMIWEREKPSINEEICTGCALCRAACVLEPSAINISTQINVGANNE